METVAQAAGMKSRAGRPGHLGKHAAYVMAAAQGSSFRQGAGVHNAPDYGTSNFKTLAPRLFEMAGITPRDVDVAQCYENFTGAVVMAMVEHGLWPPEEANEFFPF